jgi:hypothetical protein
MASSKGILDDKTTDLVGWGMALGPGRYGANAEKLIREFGTDLCVVIMFGPKGAAFDVATTDPTLVLNLPKILRDVAGELEKDFPKAGKIV